MPTTSQTVPVTRENLTSGHWTRGVLHVKFRPDAFAAAGAFYEISETGKVSLPLSGGALLHAYVEQEWSNGNRVFVAQHWLGEDLAALERFLAEVLPYLEASFLAGEAHRDDPRLKEETQ